MLSVPYVAGFFDGEGCVSIFYTRIRRWKKDPEKVVHGMKCAVLIANTERTANRGHSEEELSAIMAHVRSGIKAA